MKLFLRIILITLLGCPTAYVHAQEIGSTDLTEGGDIMTLLNILNLVSPEPETTPPTQEKTSPTQHQQTSPVSRNTPSMANTSRPKIENSEQDNDGIVIYPHSK